MFANLVFLSFYSVVWLQSYFFVESLSSPASFSSIYSEVQSLTSCYTSMLRPYSKKTCFVASSVDAALLLLSPNIQDKIMPSEDAYSSLERIERGQLRGELISILQQLNIHRIALRVPVRYVLRLSRSIWLSDCFLQLYRRRVLFGLPISILFFKSQSYCFIHILFVRFLFTIEYFRSALRWNYFRLPRHGFWHSMSRFYFFTTQFGSGSLIL